MKNKVYILLGVCLILFAFISCELELQKDYDYKPSVDEPHLNITAWEYFKNNEVIFADFIEAIEYAELKEYYIRTDKKFTYLVLENAAMRSFRERLFPGVTTITDCDKEAVKEMLLYHIIDGEYSSYGQLKVEPMFVLTMLPGEQGLMTMSVWKNPWQAAVGKILINETGSNGNSPQRKVKTSNIMPLNGVIHILDQYCYYQK